MSDRCATILAQNARIAEVLRQAKAELEAIGEPDYFTAPGYDFKDVTDELEHMAPLTDAAAQGKIQAYADEKNFNDARDTLATRADFIRDRRLTE
jgi:hypothetical protein